MQAMLEIRRLNLDKLRNAGGFFLAIREREYLKERSGALAAGSLF